jgi:hypothetical protein
LRVKLLDGKGWGMAPSLEKKQEYKAVAAEEVTGMSSTSGIEMVEERPPLDSEGFPHRRLRG